MTSRFTYDADGYLATMEDRDGLVTTIERDANGIATSIVGPYGHRTTLTVNAGGWLTKVAGPGGVSYAMTYDADGLISSFTNPNGGTSTMTYDAKGKLLTDTNAEGGQVLLTETTSPTGFEVAVTSPGGRVTRYGVETMPDGSQRSSTLSPDGSESFSDTNHDAGVKSSASSDGTINETVMAPDPVFGLRSDYVTSGTVTTPGGLTKSMTRIREAVLADPNDPLSLISIKDTTTIEGKTLVSTYDAASKSNTKILPSGLKQTMTLDQLGRVVNKSVSGVEPINISYGANGKISSVTQGQRKTQYAYNALGQRIATTDALGRVTRYGFDAAGRVNSLTYPDGRMVNYGYDANGNLVSIIPPGRSAHLFAYSVVNEKLSYTPPPVEGTNGVTMHSYNLDHDLIAISRPDGSIADYRYDAGGRLATVTTPSAIYGFTFGSAGCSTCGGGVQAEGASRNNESLHYGYDGSLMTSVAWSGSVTGSVEWIYNNDFSLSQETVNGGLPVNYTYDDDGFPIQVGSLGIARNLSSGLLKGSSLDQVSTAYEYNIYGEVIRYVVLNGAELLFEVSYNRDDFGRIVGKVETVQGGATTFGYGFDLAGRLTDVTKDGTVVESYTYDANGNRTTADLNGVVAVASYDAQDRLTRYGVNTYTYATNGELKSKDDATGPTNYVYDFFDNLMQVTLPDGTQVDYVIDAENRRIAKKVNGAVTNRYLYKDSIAPVAELDAQGNVTRRYVYASHRNIPDYMIDVPNGTTYRIVADHLGSLRMVVDAATGAVVKAVDYDSYGVVMSDSNPGFKMAFGFAGGLTDSDTGLVRFGARDYEPSVGRWLAKDPILFDGGSDNLYGYVLNDPVNLYDLFGLCDEPPPSYPSNQGFCGPGAASFNDPYGNYCCWRHDWCYYDHEKCRNVCDEEFYDCFDNPPDPPAGSDPPPKPCRVRTLNDRQKCYNTRDTLHLLVRLGGSGPYKECQNR